MEYNPDAHSLQCPKCEHGMDEVTYDNITIDRCSNCQGLWFDGDEAHQLKLKQASKIVDIGDPTEGWKWNSHADIRCPRCKDSPLSLQIPSKCHH